ncbi:hypothetical protein HYALB_00007746 [Hymenoscyphus albidus]|uniref:Uncharacterized protein n=1 Tax=Hymenoscyphus albidus TaxID=595503 RepID=A0A9N9LHR0_9HELO|nr:hypothetical protein HYALB_00007746 [Hymenoscyphus albidus]
MAGHGLALTRITDLELGTDWNWDWNWNWNWKHMKWQVQVQGKSITNCRRQPVPAQRVKFQRQLIHSIDSISKTSKAADPAKKLL